MKYIFLSISIIFSTGLLAQDSLFISILGRAPYVEISKDYNLELRFEENPNRCDPNIGFVSLEDQLKHFKESIQSVGADPDRLEMIESLLYSEYRTQKCTYSDSNFTRMVKVIEKCHNLNIIIESSQYLFDPHSFEKEDLKAINAFNDAKNKAEIFKNEFGFENLDVISIDDDTSFSTLDDLLIDRSEEEKERMMEILALLNENPNNTGMHSRSSRNEKKSSTYTLKVRFCLSNN